MEDQRKELKWNKQSEWAGDGWFKRGHDGLGRPGEEGSDTILKKFLTPLSCSLLGLSLGQQEWHQRDEVLLWVDMSTQRRSFSLLKAHQSIVSLNPSRAFSISNLITFLTEASICVDGTDRINNLQRDLQISVEVDIIRLTNRSVNVTGCL